MEGISDLGAAQEWLKDACRELGLQEDVKIVMVVNRWRWTLEYEQSASYPDFAMGMIDLETKLRDTLKRPIDLRLEAEADKNMRKRRNVLASGKPGS